ncbi:MAG: S8 family peptidase [Verrucomicrobiota bacterium]|jgi:subtilisin family serine protease|nr:S8 family peptidase [Verrucomicrobiota bacterium]
MRNNVTRPVALAGFLGLALTLIWTGPKHTPSRESVSNNKSITARARAAMLYSSPRSPLVSANHPTPKQHAGSRQNPTHKPSQQFSIAQAWRTHEGAKINPAPVALPEGTAFVRGIPVHPSRVVARIRPEISRDALANALDGVGASIAIDPNPSGWLTVDLAPTTPEDEALGAETTLLTRMKVLQGTGTLEAIEPDYLLTHTATPGDAGYNQGWLWGLHNTGQNGGTAGIDIGATKAWDTTTGSSNVIVAIIDTGVRYTHQDLEGQMWINSGEIPGNGVDDDNDGYVDNVHGIDVINNDGDPMDDNSHGTHCAGTIGARANNGHAHVGVAWQVRLMACKFLSGDGWGYTSGAIECIDFAVSNGAKVLSNSWGGGGFSQGLYDSIASARDAGVVFVAAAGNSGQDTDSSPQYPSAYDLENIIAVAAIDRNGQLASWSNYGHTTVDLGAPGVDIFSSVADSDSSYSSYSGTSMATPHVSGVAALLFANDNTLSVSKIKAQLLNTSVLLDDLRDRTVSSGLVNAANALDGGDDGELEIVLTVSDNPLRGGRKAAVMAQVSDVTPVTGANVTGDMDGTSLAFADDGNVPDETADDGIYTATMEVSDDTSVESVMIYATAEATDKAPVSTSLTVAVIHTPANDNFDERAGLSGRKVSLSGFTNRAATAEDNEPRHYWSKPLKSVWFTWASPRTGRADIWLKGSDFDTVMAVYRGSTLDNLRRVARDDDGGGKLTSRVRFNVRKGRTYHFAVDGWSGAEGDINGRLVVKKRKPFKRSRKWWQ